MEMSCKIFRSFDANIFITFFFRLIKKITCSPPIITASLTIIKYPTPSPKHQKNFQKLLQSPAKIKNYFKYNRSHIVSHETYTQFVKPSLQQLEIWKTEFPLPPPSKHVRIVTLVNLCSLVST